MRIPVNLPQPKTIDEARRQILTTQRAEAILNGEGGYIISFGFVDGVIYVSHPDALYLVVDCEDRFTCDCEAFKKRGDYCKHSLAAAAWSEAKQDEARVADYEAMIAGCELESVGCDPYAKF